MLERGERARAARSAVLEERGMLLAIESHRID
jgi:hypothetical protein